LGRETNWLDKSYIKVFVNFTKKLTVGLQLIYFYCIFRDSTVLHAVSCLLGCSFELHDNNQPSTAKYALLCHDCFDVLTSIDFTAFLPTGRHATV